MARCTSFLFSCVVLGYLAAGTSAYIVHRNVKDYGAVGDGVHDDTNAFLQALTDEKATVPAAPGAPWNNSQYGPQTTLPSIVYVPLGVYLITATLPLTYYTQLVGIVAGNASWNRPTLWCQIAAGTPMPFNRCLDAGIDEGPGTGWYGSANQDNFYHQMRNIIVHLRSEPPAMSLVPRAVASSSSAVEMVSKLSPGPGCPDCTAIHWQVSQATNLVNVEFVLCDTCYGLYMEDGSGGYMGDLIFRGGKVAMKMGNQQFTVRNVSVYDTLDVGIHMLWGWSWSFFDVRVTGVIGGGASGGRGFSWLIEGGVNGISLVDCEVNKSAVGIVIVNTETTELVADNFWIDPSSVNTPVELNWIPAAFLSGEPFWFIGPNSTTSDPTVRSARTFVPKERSKYLVQKSSPTGVKKYAGFMRPVFNANEIYIAQGLINGTDVTAQLQHQIHLAHQNQQVLMVPYGEYYISHTVFIPAGSRIFGEVWTRLVATSNFTQPPAGQESLPMIQVGNSEDQGIVQLMDFMLTNRGPVPHVTLLEWNVGLSTEYYHYGIPSGMWDVHARIGGAVGTEINPSDCPVTTTYQQSPQCAGVHTILHLTKNASAYIENFWGWVADHDIDTSAATQTQINVYSARGMWVEESVGPIWLYGTAMEHSTIYQYFFDRPHHLMGGVLQTETPYYQPEFVIRPSKQGIDPKWVLGTGAHWLHSYAIAIRELPEAEVSGSPSVTLYGTGDYSFFHRWNLCQNDPCQRVLIAVYGGIPPTAPLQATNATSTLFLLNSHGSDLVAWVNGVPFNASDSGNGFCSTLSLF